MPFDSFETFIEATCTESHLRVEADLGDGFVRLRSDEAQRRQAAQDIRNSESILIELLRNSRDAHAQNIYVAVSKIGNERHITVIDDGDGIPEHLHTTIFEPRVTSKLNSMHMDTWGVHGRGMALYSIAQNSLSAQVTFSEPGLGTVISVCSDTTQLPEKTDQSTFPSFHKTEEKTIKVTGPKNIFRTVCEFVIEAKSRVNVYCGSPAEILATICEQDCNTKMSAAEIFDIDDSDLPITFQIAQCCDSYELADLANTRGLQISERSARRILNGEIKPLASILDLILSQINSELELRKTKHKHSQKGKTAGRIQNSHARSTVKISKNDLHEFASEIESSFKTLAQKYYLNTDVEVSLKQSNSGLDIIIPFERLE